MSVEIELEIKALLTAQRDPDEIAKELIQAIENPDHAPITKENNQALANYLILSGQNRTLIQYVQSHLLDDNFPIPWAQFLDAIAQVYQPITEDMAKLLIEGINKQQAQLDACRSQALDKFSIELKELRHERRMHAEKEFHKLKRQLLDELHVLRTQQLFEQEKILLSKLRKIDPTDPVIIKEYENHKERNAYEILARHKPNLQRMRDKASQEEDLNSIETSEALAQSLVTAAKKNPSMSYDFALACYSLEKYEHSLSLLGSIEPTPEADWLLLEVLLKSRRFAELLSQVSQVELKYAADPETFFATAYMRAQALWGLGQRHNAIEVLESLLASRPNYRSGESLLNVWRSL